MFELESQWFSYALPAAMLASVHVWFPSFDRHCKPWESQWIGFVGGIAIGYVTLYLIPKLGRFSVSLITADPSLSGLAPLRVYLTLLTGILFYLIMDWLDHQQQNARKISAGFDYAVHGAYSLLVGYVLIELPPAGTLVLSLSTAILLLHLMGMNHILRKVRGPGYDRSGRWILSTLVVIGSGMALFTEMPATIMNGLTAFVAGIILVNVVTMELPIGRQRRLPWFFAGVACFVTAAAFIFDAPVDSVSEVVNEISLLE